MNAERLMHIQANKIASGDVGHQRWPPYWNPVRADQMPEIEDLGKKVMADYNQREGTNVVLLKVSKAITELFCCGRLYDSTLEVADQGDNVMTIQKMLWKGYSRQIDVPKETLVKRELIADDEVIVHPDNDTIEEVAKFGLWQLQGERGTLALEKVVMHEVRETKDEGKGPEFSKFTTYRLTVLTKPRPTPTYRSVTRRRGRNMVVNGSQFSFIVLDRAWLKILDPEVENSFRSRVKLPFVAPLPIRLSDYKCKDSKPLRKNLKSQLVVSVHRKLSIADMCSPFVITVAWISLEDHNFRTREQLRFVQVVKGSYRETSGTNFILTLVAEDQGVFKLFKTEVYAYMHGSAFSLESTPLTEVIPMSKKNKILDSENSMQRMKKPKFENSPPAGARSSERLKILRLKRLAEEGNI